MEVECFPIISPAENNAVINDCPEADILNSHKILEMVISDEEDSASEMDSSQSSWQTINYHINAEINPAENQLKSVHANNNNNSTATIEHIGDNNYLVTIPSSSANNEKNVTGIETSHCNQHPSQWKLDKSKLQQLGDRKNVGSKNFNYRISANTKSSHKKSVLTLTEEEKQTLIAEGYSVPTKLPLSKEEDKSLKIIRRKIRNKASAHESRMRRKAYVDNLERNVKVLLCENANYRRKIETLTSSNENILSKLLKLQSVVARTHPQLLKTMK